MVRIGNPADPAEVDDLLTERPCLIVIRELVCLMGRSSFTERCAVVDGSPVSVGYAWNDHCAPQVFAKWTFGAV